MSRNRKRKRTKAQKDLVVMQERKDPVMMQEGVVYSVARAHNPVHDSR